ncbi:MAG: hypothetical protein F7B17_00190 [Desulfurococcales archaeon]|nr:hypothetical protein [Desulfurococcales archaeon]
MAAGLFAFRALDDGRIEYTGNNVYKPIEDVRSLDVTGLEPGPDEIRRLSRINAAMYKAVVEYFGKVVGAEFVVLPLITRMLSSPGAAFKELVRGRRLVSDQPLEVEAFTIERFFQDQCSSRDPCIVFLSESSQLYLEITIAYSGISRVYSVYNSFRREEADWCHLTEFHHVEFEGRVSQEENESIAMGLIRHLVKRILEEAEDDVLYYVDRDYVEEVEYMASNPKRVRLAEALYDLYNFTGNRKYREFTSRHLGSWEELKLTQIYETFVVLKEYPYFETFFYQTYRDPVGPDTVDLEFRVGGESLRVKAKAYNGVPVADNADIIWPGYREVVGSGHRVRTAVETEYRIRRFLGLLLYGDPKKGSIRDPDIDRITELYRPYIEIRSLRGYRETSGFGLGWERFLQGLLKLPSITLATPFPRTHKPPRV